MVGLFGFLQEKEGDVTTKLSYRDQLNAMVRESIKRNLANHQIRQRHRDGDVVRLWRCDNNGSSIYHFSVLASPGWLMMYGDMGECMWSRVPDMLSFVRGSIGSLGYFSEKASKNCIIEEDRAELISEFLEDFEKDFEENRGEPMTDEQREEFRELRDGFDPNNHDVSEFQRDFWNSSFCYDSEAMPDTKCYTFHYLWKIEALKWFIKKLDAGEFVKDVYEWEKS